jgi:hypothetical protein
MTPRRDDLDTDPDAIREEVRAGESAGEVGALSRRARPTWNVLLLIASVLTGATAVAFIDAAAATRIAEKVVAPVEKKVDDHLLEMRGDRYRMEAYVQSQEKIIGEIRSDSADTRKMIRALCRASAKPQICLGGE